MAAKIVVVDDSRTQRSTIALALERQGYQVTQGTNGLEALHLVHSENPDLLVSDIMMPELTGYQVCRLLKNDSATEDLPIILLTTLDQQEHRFWGKEAGADSYVLKGAGTAPLEQEVARLLAEKKRKPAAKPVSRGAVPFARQTAHARLTDLLDRILFEATISNRIRETGRSNSDLNGALKNFFEFFQSLVDYQIAVLCLRGPSGPVLIVHLAERVPAAWLELAKQIILEEKLVTTKEKEKSQEKLLNPELLTTEEPAERRQLAVLSTPFSGAVEGALAVFTANRALYTDETRETLGIAVRELEPILASKLQAQELEKLKADFTAMIVHDLRAPLTAIMSSAAIIEDGLVGPVTDEQKNWLLKITTGSRSLLNLINDFLDLSKIEAGRLELIRAEVDLEQLIQANLDDYTVLTREKKISLSARIEQPLSPITADAGRLGQVFTNLISNAIKFTGEGGTIELGAAQNDGETTVWVKDSGVGIPAHEIGDLFEKYRQTQSGKTSEHKGTGLGLVICKMIVESHGGKIWAESQEGKGTTFFFTLPATREIPVESKSP
jgi:signal transduction histidine kinase/CheY-like chemotaxis protein